MDIKHVPSWVRFALVTVWGLLGVFAYGEVRVWWEKQRLVDDTPSLSGWGLLYFGGLLALAACWYVGYRLATVDENNRNFASAVVVTVSSVSFALALVFLWSEIGWTASWHLMLVVGGGFAYLLGFWLIQFVMNDK